jgi:hypothetical protein
MILKKTGEKNYVKIVCRHRFLKLALYYKPTDKRKWGYARNNWTYFISLESKLFQDIIAAAAAVVVVVVVVEREEEEKALPFSAVND